MKGQPGEETGIHVGVRENIFINKKLKIAITLNEKLKLQSH